MSYDELKKKVSDHREKKENIDDEDISLSRDESRLSELMVHSMVLDADLQEKLSKIESDYKTIRKRIDTEKETLEEEKKELTGTIKNETEKVRKTNEIIDNISDNRYAVGSDKARRKSEEYLNQLKDMANILGEGTDDLFYGNNGGFSCGISDRILDGSYVSPDIPNDDNTQTSQSSGSSVGIARKNESSALYGDGEFTPLLVTGQNSETLFLDGKCVDVFDHPFEPNEYRICDQGSAFPPGWNGNSEGITQTCGCCSSGTLINKAGGRTSEKDVVEYALKNGLCASDGGTWPESWVGILGGADISSSVTSGTSLEELAKKVEEGHGVIIGVSARTYCPEMYGHYYPGVGDGHAMVLESVIRDHDTGEIIEYVVSDSNGNNTYDACHRVPAKVLDKAYRRKMKASVVTNEVIW